jgi:uncharacterized protein (DUF1778 family)
MARTNPVAIRFTPETKNALERAAHREERSFANLVNRITAEWARAHGYLPAEPEAPEAPKTKRTRK